MVAQISVSRPAIVVNLDLAREVALLWIEKEFPTDYPREISIGRVMVVDMFGMIDVSYSERTAIGTFRGCLFIPASFWIWAEAQIELERLLTD